MLHINPLCYSILQSLSIQMKHTHPTISQRWYLLGLIGTCLLLVWISSQVFLVKLVLFVLGDDTHMTSMKIFKTPTPLSSYVQNSSTALTLDVQFQTNCSPQPLRFPLRTNQLKGNIILGWLLYVIRSFLQVGFRFQYQLINLVWLSIDFFSFSWNQSRTHSNFKKLKPLFRLLLIAKWCVKFGSSLSWSLTIYFFVALHSFVCSCSKISRNFF